MMSPFNIALRPLNESDMALIRESKQIFSDCYLLSSLHSLTQSSRGRNLLGSNVERRSLVSRVRNSVLSEKFYKDNPYLAQSNRLLDSFNIKFRSINGKQEDFFISEKEYKKYSDVASKQKNPLALAFECAMSELIEKNPSKKPFLSRLIFPLKRRFEYNKVSNFLEMFTGKKPYILAESAINLSLKPYKEEVYRLFEKMGNTKGDDYSFVAGSGMKKMDDGRRWHCYTVLHTDNNSKKIVLLNKRTNIPKEYSFDEAIKKLKYFVGYFNEDLK